MKNLGMLFAIVYKESGRLVTVYLWESEEKATEKANEHMRKNNTLDNKLTVREISIKGLDVTYTEEKGKYKAR